MKIDVHAHFVPPSCEDLIGGGRGPSNNMRDSMTDLDVRLADMTDRGVDIELVSTPTSLASNDVATIRRLNDETAKAISAHPDRLIGLATVALHEPEEAARELERCVKELGFKGAEIMTNVQGDNLHEAKFAPFFRKMEELDAAVFVHPNNVLGADRLGSFYLNNMIGNPTDTSVAAASLIFGGVLQEMPTLKFVLAHGGGTCPLLRGRWEHGWNSKLVDTPITRPPSEYFRYLYFDSLVHSTPVLNYLVDTVGPERVMLGSDYPYGMGDPRPAASVAALPHASDADKQMMYSGNAIRVFGLDIDDA